MDSSLSHQGVCVCVGGGGGGSVAVKTQNYLAWIEASWQLDFIDSWSLHPYLLFLTNAMYHHRETIKSN